MSIEQERARAHLLGVMARAAFDAEWEQPGNPAPEKSREANWRLYEQRYLLMMRRVLPAMFKAGYGVAPVRPQSVLQMPAAPTIITPRAGSSGA